MTEATSDNRCFPSALADVARVESIYHEGDGVDFEPYDTFESAAETTDWLRHWTGNHELDGDVYRVFGQDGTGGLAALWLVRPGRELTEQPVVFMGSEGECGVVAGNLSDFLWLLADGTGPMEAVEYESHDSRPDAALGELAERHATTPRRSAQEIITEARATFPSFVQNVEALCR
jgi:hypothetical protein